MAGGGMGMDTGMDDMGMDTDMGLPGDDPLAGDDMGLPGDELDGLDDIEDEFGGDPAMAGPEDEQLGREMKEGFIKAVGKLKEARDALLLKKAQK